MIYPNERQTQVTKIKKLKAKKNNLLRRKKDRISQTERKMRQLGSKAIVDKSLRQRPQLFPTREC